MIEWSDW